MRWRRLLAGLLLAGCAAPLGGCVAFNVGQPEAKLQTKRFVEEGRTPVRTKVLEVRPTHGATWKSIRVGLGGDLQDEYRQTSHTVTSGQLEQKRLAFGLFPGAAEEYALPKGAEKHGCLKPDYPTAFFLGILPAGLFVGLGTAHALLLELPFGSYDCWKKPQTEGFSHLGLAGFHKYTAIIPQAPERSPDREEPSVFKNREKIAATGPYEVAFAIPGLGFSGRKTVKAGESGVPFDLPTVERDFEGDAVVAFRRIPGEVAADISSALLLDEAEGRRFRFTLFLHPPPKAPPSQRPASRPEQGPSQTLPGQQPALPQQTLPQAPVHSQRQYEIAGIEPLDGGEYRIRVLVNDLQRTFSIGWQVEEDVKLLIRNDYLSKHPRIAEAYVRETVQWNMERDGNILVLTAWAFSVRPVTDGWHYDDTTRRGHVQIRINEDMAPAEAEQWARDSIEAIVEDKNLVVISGDRPPPGAKYRILDEKCENGVLTIWFSAVE